jgi:hypothetical protein
VTLVRVHDALMRRTEDGSTRRGKRDEGKRNSGVLYGLKSPTKVTDGVSTIDLGTMRALLGQPATAGLEVTEFRNLSRACISTRHHQTDGAAALGRDFLHIEDRVEQGSNGTQATFGISKVFYEKRAY